MHLLHLVGHGQAVLANTPCNVLATALGEFLRSQKPHTTDEAINFVTHGYGALVLRVNAALT